MPRHQDHDLPMPDDTDEGSTVFDREPGNDLDRPPLERAPVKVRRSKKTGQVTNVEIPLSQNATSSQNATAEAAGTGSEPVSMVDLESARPPLAQQLAGKLTVERVSVNHAVCADGVSVAETGYAGEVEDAPNCKTEIWRQWGGGSYLAKGLDKNGKARAVSIKIAGKSKPIQGTAVPEPDDTSPTGWSVDGVPYDLPKEASPHADRAPAYGYGPGPTFTVDGGYEDPRFGAPARSFAPGFANDRRYGGYSAGYQQPGFDYGETATEKELREKLAAVEREKEINALQNAYDDKLAAAIRDVGGGKNSMAEYTAMLAEQREREREEKRERAEAEERRRDEEKEFRRAEAERLREEKREEREREEKREEREREARREEREREREERRTQAEAAKETARLQAEVARDAARMSAESSKEIAKAQAEAQKFMVEVLLKKTDGDSSVDRSIARSIEMAKIMQGNNVNPEQSVVAQTAEAIERAVPAVAQAVTDGIYAYKGYPIPQRQPGQVGQVPMNQPPQIGMTNPPTAGQAAPQGDIPTAQETVQSLQLVHFLVESWKNGEKPLRSVVRHGCRAYGVQNVTGTINMLLMATPEIVVAKFEQGVNALGNQPPFPAMLADVRAMAGSQQGRAWFQALQEEVRQGQVAMAQGQQASPAPVAGQEATKQ